MKRLVFLFLLGPALLITCQGLGQIQMLDTGWHHIRNAEPREWSAFPETADQKKLVLRFRAQRNNTEHTLALRQYDVKLNWVVLLNGQSIGTLVGDEKDLMCLLKIPAGLLAGDNTLEISCSETTPDDINVGEIGLHGEAMDQLLSQAHVSVEVIDADANRPVPSRITIVNDKGILYPVTAYSGDPLAVRPGYVYTAKGYALLGLPGGTYTLYAGRGFEYGIDSAKVTVQRGGYTSVKLNIRREVATAGWISSDTHIHTFTWSRHGDATGAERVLTIAGEGLELPILTDHNVQVDIKPFAIDLGLQGYFTPVMGNEVTTAVGHFNVFPLDAEHTIIPYGATNWSTLSQNFRDENSQAIVLNHARDIHVGFRPFDPEKHLSSAGMRLDQHDLPANAMEVINSGSQQSDRMQLTRDWLGLLNHGHFVTPVGSSDSHDVSRYIVGQARTYIRCSDDDPANIDVSEAVRNFREGNVMVSFGLLTEIEINQTYGPGELAPPSDDIHIAVKVSGPSWIRADRVILMANGKKIREEKISEKDAGGVKWSGHWNLPLPGHDVFLTVLAEGPDRKLPFWPIAKPYQHVSPEWQGGVMGLSGAVWIDADRNGKRNSAKDYAENLFNQADNDLNELIHNLSTYDEAVAIQVAALLHKKGVNLAGPEVSRALRRAKPETKSGFQTVIRELNLVLK